ncbi:MAG TPA: SET domain-containing protein-lysine N-methyltransferase [Burkholderiales bacterium]|nr:SET domain-containing protein-lysine N-methyltransferase [Burkholderiales bacterium]
MPHKKQLNGRKQNGYKPSGHQLNGHGLNGHELNGHRLNGHKPNGQPVNGHALDARPLDGAGPLYVVRRSSIHGRGVFAARDIPKGTRIIEYRGVRISYDRAAELYPDFADEPTHTFLFEIDDDTVIDAGQRGNAARWINHSCAPNCEAVDEDGRIYIEAIRRIRAGEELGYDYNITLEERHSTAEQRRWACLCGARGCRGTLLAKKR